MVANRPAPIAASLHLKQHPYKQTIGDVFDNSTPVEYSTVCCFLLTRKQ